MTREPCDAHGAPFDLPEEHRSHYGHKLPCVGEALSLPKGRGVQKTIHVIGEPREDRELLVVDKWGWGSMSGHQHVSNPHHLRRLRVLAVLRGNLPDCCRARRCDEDHQAVDLPRRAPALRVLMLQRGTLPKLGS